MKSGSGLKWVYHTICSRYVLLKINGGMMKEVDIRLDRMIEIAEHLDVPLDHVVEHIGRVDHHIFLRVSGNPSLLPRYIKSKVTP